MNIKGLIKPVAVSIVCLSLLSGCASMGKMMAEMATSSTEDVTTTDIEVMYWKNLYPKEADETLQAAMYTDEIPWVDGGSLVGVMFTEKDSTDMISMTKLDGTIKLNNEVAPYLGIGTFARSYQAPGPQKVSIDITDKLGNNVQFDVKAPPAIKIISINGQSNGPFKIDPAKGIRLKLDIPRSIQGKYIQIEALADVVTATVYYPFAIVKAKNEIYLSPKVMRHAWFGGTSSIISFNSDNFLKVVYVDKSKFQVGKRTVKTTFQTIDSKTIEFTGDFNTIEKTATLIEMDGGFTSTVWTANASHARPFTQGKKFALINLSLDNTLFREESSTSGDTVTTSTWQFPDKTYKQWDEYLSLVYKDIRNILSPYGISFVSRSKVTSSKAFQKSSTRFEEENNPKRVKHSYNNSNTFPKPNIGRLPLDITSDAAANLMKELGVDGLVFVTIKANMGDTKSVTLKTNLNIEVFSPGITPETTLMQYFNAKIDTGNGRATNNPLYKVMRQDHVKQALSKGLKELEPKLKVEGYYDVWSMR